MGFEAKPASRERIPLLIGVAGPTGSGKTYSALRLATGIARGRRFALVDTENRRALHYAPKAGEKPDPSKGTFDFDHVDFDEPFTPERYLEAIRYCQGKGYPVVVIDSGSHEWAGEGGVLESQEDELERMAGKDWKKREACKMASWVKPKGRHKAFVRELIRMRCHVILCLRAEEKIEMVEVQQGNQKKKAMVPKKTLSGFEGWLPICDQRLPFELLLCLLVLPDRKGCPIPIKLEGQHEHCFPKDEPISERSGELLAAWSDGKDQPHGGAKPPEVGGRATGGAASDSPAQRSTVSPGRSSVSDPGGVPESGGSCPSDAEPKSAGVLSDEQLANVRALIDEIASVRFPKATWERQLPGYYQCSKLEEIPADEYESLVKRLEGQRRS